MPVEHVELVHLHQVEVVQDDALGEEVARRVEHHAAVGETGVVEDLGAVQLVLK